MKLIGLIFVFSACYIIVHEYFLSVDFLKILYFQSKFRTTK